MFLIIVSNLFVILLTLLYWSQRKYDYWKKKNIKFTKPCPFFGNYRDYIWQKVNLGEMTMKICQKFPNEPMVGAFYGTEPVLIVQDPELIKLVTLKDFYYFNAREVSEYCHKEVLTRNMFFTYGDNWKVLRQNLTPLFSPSKMKNMFYLIEKCTKVYEKLLDEETQNSNVMEVRGLVVRYTMDCICSAAFGIDTNVMGKNIKTNPFKKMGEVIFESSINRGVRTVCRAIWPAIFYKLGFTLFPPEINEFFKSVLFNVFKDRNYAPSSRQDFVDLIMSFKNNDYIIGDSVRNMKGDNEKEKIKVKVDDELLVAQCVLFFAAGFETSSSTAAFTLYELAKSPKDLKRVLEEVDQYMSTRSKVQYDCTTEVPFLEQCVDETLRLYPVLPILTREVYDNYVFPNGIKLEKGMRVHIPLYHIQRDPRFFKDPNVFMPDRFSPENKNNILPYTYFPFGEGPRLCIGMRFAKMQMLAGLVTLLKKYRVELADGMPTQVKYEPSSMVTQSTLGIKLKLIERDGWEQRMFKNV